MQPSAPTRVANTKNRDDHGFSLIELLIVVAIILIIAAIAIPNLLRSRQSANQAAAVANVRTITTAAVSYWVTYSNGYPPSLASLGGTTNPATCKQAILIDEVIATAPNQNNGYQYAYAGEQGNVANPPAGCTAGFNGYVVSAVPLVVGTTGLISYCSTEPGIIHYDSAGGAIADGTACAALPTL